MSTTSDWSRFPGLPFAFPFETNYDQKWHREWFTNNWMVVSIPVSIVYVIAVFAGQRWMRDRKPFNLRTPLAGWSLLLSIFSAFGTMRLLPELIATIKGRGLEASMCDNRWQEDVRVEFWIYCFVWSKVFELVDTGFIVLRKQKLIFLHWYHHFATLTYAFYGFGQTPSVYRWFAGMNFAIHTVMYGYYSLRAMRIRIPNPIAVFITTSQILQMVAGTAINILALLIKINGGNCAMTNWALVVGLFIYTGFLILFANFFIQTYLVKGSKKLPVVDNRNAKIKSN